MTRRLLTPVALLLLLAAPLLAASCSSDTADKTKDAAKSAKEDAKDAASTAKDKAGKATDKVAARSAAEALRVSLKGNKTADKNGIRSVDAINEAAADLPGDATFSGVEDTTGDGLDDDGKVQVDVGDYSACLSLPEKGENIDVAGGAC